MSNHSEQIAKIVCNKPDNFTCEECFYKIRSQICQGNNNCRISEKNQEQLKYVTSMLNENTYLKACAGSGKTEVVGLKAAYEIKQWNQEGGIAVLSFTNDATDVIKDRVKRFLGDSRTSPHYIGTLGSFIHSYIVQPFAYKIVGYSGNNNDYSLSLVDEKISIHTNHWLNNFRCSVPYIDANNKKLDIYANQIGFDMGEKDFYFYVGDIRLWLKQYYKFDRIQKFIFEKRKTRSYFWEENYLRRCLWRCKEEFWKNGFVTFDDLNILAVRIVKSDIGSLIAKRFPIIIIDECQDLSGNELKVLKQLAKKGCKIHCVGDLNQSIYDFKNVKPEFIAEYLTKFETFSLTLNYRSCKEIVAFSNKLIQSEESESALGNSILGSDSLMYIEYSTPQDAIEKYVDILNNLKWENYENRILVKQNSLKKLLENSTQGSYDEKEPLLVAVQLWENKTPNCMLTALELAGKQVSKWFGGGKTSRNYYCPPDITSVFAWKVFLMNILDIISDIPELNDFSQTYGKWHEVMRKKINVILEQNYNIISEYDSLKDRDITTLVTGRNFAVSNGNKNVPIISVTLKTCSTIPVMTIHASKGCTFDTTLVISSETEKSNGGHWKRHWLMGSGEEKRIGYVASTRAKYLLIWAVPILTEEDRKLIESYGFVPALDFKCDKSEKTQELSKK